MAKGKVQSRQKADEDSPFGAIIAKTYSDFAGLVMKSYFPRFTETSKATEAQVSKEEPASPKSGKEPQAP